MLLLLLSTQSSLAGQVAVIDFDAVDVTAERPVPLVRLVQEFTHRERRSEFTYEDLVGVLHERALRRLGMTSPDVDLLRSMAVFPVTDYEDAVGIELAVYDADSSHVLPAGVYEYHMYSSASGSMWSGYAVVRAEGGASVLRDWPEDRWCTREEGVRTVGFFNGEGGRGCEDESASPSGVYASVFAWEEREDGLYVPAESFLYGQARRLRDTPLPKTTSWCPEEVNEWGDLQANCQFRIPAVQVYEVDANHLSEKAERIFLLGPPEKPNPSTQSRLVGFFRYIPDVVAEREERVHAAFDGYTQAPFGACVKSHPDGEKEVLVCSDVKVTYGASSVMLWYTSESADYYRTAQSKCLGEARTAEDRKFCKAMYKPSRVTPAQTWSEELKYENHFGQDQPSWRLRGLPPTNMGILDIQVAIPSNGQQDKEGQ
jgi:hypothetical protein